MICLQKTYIFFIKIFCRLCIDHLFLFIIFEKKTVKFSTWQTDVNQINLTSLPLIYLRVTKRRILGLICLQNCAVLYLRSDSLRNYNLIEDFWQINLRRHAVIKFPQVGNIDFIFLHSFLKIFFGVEVKVKGFQNIVSMERVLLNHIKIKSIYEPKLQSVPKAWE